MLDNAFIGYSSQPTDAELSAALGPARELWDSLLRDLADHLGLTDYEWKSPYPKYGWSLRVMRKKRNILYLGPGTQGFMVASVLGDRAVAAARAEKFPKSFMKILDKAPRYPEGTGVRLEVKGARDLKTIEKLAAIKLAN